MTLKEEVITLAARLGETHPDELALLLEDLRENGTDHEDGHWVDSMASAIVDAAIEMM